MAATPHSVTILDDVDELMQASQRSKEKGEEVPCCQFEEDAALNAAVKLKAMVDSGAVRLLNPRMLAGKLQAKASLEEWIQDMIDRTPFSAREMQALDESIALLKNRLQTPYAVAYPESMEEEAIISEVQTQRVSWAVDLKVLEVKKKVLADHARTTQETFNGMLADELRTPSFMGSGSTDYNFLTHAGQLLPIDDDALPLDDMEFN